MADFIEIEEFETNFAQVPKSALKDPNLSLKAKGLYAYLFSLPKNWKVYRTELGNHVSDGKDSLNSAFKELEKFGYLMSEPVRDKGQFKGYKLKLLIASNIPSENEPQRKNRSGKTGSGKSAPNNNDSNNNSLFKNKEYNVAFDFITAFNKKRNSGFKLTAKCKWLPQFKQLLKDNYTVAEILRALENAMGDQYHIDNEYNHLTPEFITREDKFAKYLNYVPVKKQKEETKTGIFL